MQVRIVNCSAHARLTNIDYLYLRTALRKDWLAGGRVFSFLLPREQWALHDYFHPSRGLTDTEAIQHRRDIIKRRPGLPQRAGRAYNQFLSAAAAFATHRVHTQATPAASTRGDSRRERLITVKPLVKPEPDLQRYARAVLEFAKAELKREREEQDRSEQSGPLE